MHRSRSIGWLPDIARASIVSILWFGVTIAATGLAVYGGTQGALLMILALVLTPWAAAWVACLALPADRRVVVRLAVGAICGFLLLFAAGYAADRFIRPWRLGDSSPWLSEGGEASLIIAGWILGPLIGALLFSRWRR
jgi:hypothetical protein